MLKCIEEFGKYVEIAGFKNAKIYDVGKFCEGTKKAKPPKVELQFFNARRIATWKHLYFAVLNAATAFEKQTNASRSLAVETMLYASAQCQIREAMSIVGINEKCSEIAVIIIGNEPKTMKTTLAMVSERIQGKRDDNVLEMTPETSEEIEKEFEISPSELEAIAMNGKRDQALLNLILERVALVSTRR